MSFASLPLKDIVSEIKDGGTPSRKLAGYFGGDVRWCVVKDIQPNILRTAETLTADGLANCSAKVWPIGSIIISLGATIGLVGIARVPTATKQGIAGIVVDPRKISAEYLAHYLRFRRPEIQSFAKGTTIKEVRPSALAERLMVPVPSLAEQQRIVAILDEAFEGIAAAVEKAEQNLVSVSAIFDRRQSELFEGLLDARQLTLAAVAKEFGRGKSKHRPRNDPELYGGEFPFIQTGDVRNADRVVTEFGQTYNALGLAQSKLWPAGTLCITIAANIAETAILGFDACFPDSVIGMVVDDEKATADYVLYCLKHFKKVLLAKGKGSAQDNINLATFESTPFPFPSLDKQRRIADDLNSLAERLGEFERMYIEKLALLAELKQSLLARAFSGELTHEPLAA